MDSHADISCVNKHAFIESIVEVMRVNAVPFEKCIGKISDLQIINAIYAYDNLNTFRTILLQINHVIYIKDMKHALLCPNQSREYSNIIDDTPPHLDHKGTGIFTITSGYYGLPLEQYGHMAYIHLRRPSEDELGYCPIIDIY